MIKKPEYICNIELIPVSNSPINYSHYYKHYDYYLNSGILCCRFRDISLKIRANISKIEKYSPIVIP